MNEKLIKLGNAVKKAREAKGYTHRELAKIADIKSPGEISQIENANRKNPSAITIKKIAKALSLDYFQLFSLIDYIDKNDLKLEGNATVLDAKIIELPVYGKASAGNGYINLDNIISLKRVIANGFSKDSYLVEVSGDSMEPQISEGSYALVDPQELDYLPGKIYVVTYDEQTFIKKIELHQDGKLIILKSFNPKYEDVVLMGDTIKDLKVEGRVVKVIREQRF